MTDPTRLTSMRRFDWERIVLRTRFKPVALKALALTLATYADEESGKRIFPGVERLALDLCQNEKTVRRNLEALERFGLIFRISSGSTYGRRGNMASEYQLTAPNDAFEFWKQRPDAQLLFADNIAQGHRPSYSTWTERNPRNTRAARTSDISDRTSDIARETPGAHAHPSTIFHHSSFINQEPTVAPPTSSGAQRRGNVNDPVSATFSRSDERQALLNRVQACVRPGTTREQRDECADDLVAELEAVFPGVPWDHYVWDQGWRPPAKCTGRLDAAIWLNTLLARVNNEEGQLEWPTTPPAVVVSNDAWTESAVPPSDSLPWPEVGGFSGVFSEPRTQEDSRTEADRQMAALRAQYLDDPRTEAAD